MAGVLCCDRTTMLKSQRRAGRRACQLFFPGCAAQESQDLINNGYRYLGDVENRWLSTCGKGEEYTGCRSRKLTNFAKMRR